MLKENCGDQSDGIVVLIVDDQAVMQRLIKRLLCKQPIQWRFASTIEGAQQELAADDIDAVLLDLNLGPDAENGISILRYIREQKRSSLPVCIVSADRTAESLFHALLTQADGFLCKTDDPEVFKNSLTRFVQAVQSMSIKTQLSADELYLRTRGLTDRQIQLLNHYSQSNYSEKALVIGDDLSCSENAVNKMFSRILNNLGYSRKSELHQLLTILSGFSLKNKVSAKASRDPEQAR